MLTAEMAIQKLQPKIKKSLHSTKFQEREDLEQELNMKITECFHNNVFKSTPGFWEFLDQFNSD